MNAWLPRLALLLPLLAPAGCVDFGSVDFEGLSVRDDAGVVSVDGVSLPHARWEPLDLPAGTATLRLACATRELRVATVAPGEPARLEVQVFSQLEGEGALALEDGQPVARPTGTGRVLANGLRGTIPAGVRLETSCGTGDAAVQAPHGLAGLQARCGTGGLEVSGGPLGDVSLTNGTGTLTLAGVQAGTVRLDSGTGGLHASGLECEALEVEAGTGDVDFRGVSCERLRVKVGTSDVRLTDCTAARAHIASGTGDVIQAGRTELGAAEYELGTGKVRLEPQP